MNNADRKKRLIVTGMFFLFAIMIISFASAVTYCDASSISKTWKQGESASATISCTNQNNSTSVTMGKVGSYFSTNPPMPILLQGLNQQQITINFDSNAPVGTYDGMLYFSDNSDPIIINMNVTEPAEEEVDSDLIVFPTSKVVTVQQGNTKTQNILITVPSTYPRAVTIQSVDFNPGTETILFGDLNLGQVAPGNSIQIPIVFNGENAQTGTYQTQLSIFATDSEGQVPLPSVSLSLQVTAGVTPVTGDTFSTPPTCSLSATTLNLNNTYSFTCSGVVSNLDIDIPSSEYYIGKNVEISSGIYRYDFMPVKYGETDFKAEFKYNGASIFSPFSQEIRISSAGSVVAGTNLKLIFTPKLDEATGEEEKFLIQVVDNKTGSLVSDPIVLVNALEINKTGAYSFEYPFTPNKDYELRAKAPGYEDLIQTININPQKIEIRISPGAGDTSTMFNITTSVENATITIQNQDYVGNYYGVLPGGTIEIKAVKDGYKTEIINFTIDDKPKIIALSGDLKKGQKSNFTLSKVGEWIVYYKSSLDAVDRTEFARGNNSLVEFTPDKSGAYVIEVDGIHVGTFEAQGFSFKNKWLGVSAWVWILLIAIILIIIFVVVARKRAQSSYRESMSDGANLSFNVGDN